MKKIYKASLVCYMDFLGFKSLILNSVDGNYSPIELLERVKSFATLDETYMKTTQGYQLVPAISCFSDSIAISMSVVPPTLQLNESRIDRESNWQNLLVFNTIVHVSQMIAHMALLEYGLLTRGGIAIGNLYHKGNVIVGDALIKAHTAECSMANYPRLALDPNVISFYGRLDSWGHYSIQSAEIDYVSLYDSSWLTGEAARQSNGLTKNWLAGEKLHEQIICAFNDGIASVNKERIAVDNASINIGKMSAKLKWQTAREIYLKSYIENNIDYYISAHKESIAIPDPNC